MNAQEKEQVVTTNPSDETMVSRRKLLKALAATSGAVVASQMLPGQWMKPVIESGLLPAHAQGSPTPTPAPTPASGFRIFNQAQQQAGTINNCNAGNGTEFETSFEYDDPSGNIVAGKAKIFCSFFGNPTQELLLDDTLGKKQIGDGFKGKLIIPWCLRFRNTNEAVFRYQLQNGVGNLSNQITLTVSKPAGASSADGVDSSSIFK